MDYSSYSSQTTNDVLASFNTTSENGLTDQQVSDLQQRCGLNKLPSHDITWIHILLRQVMSPFFFLLIGAALLSLFLGETVSAIMLFVFTLMQVGLGFYQEYHAERILQSLKSYTVHTVRVIRNGKVSVVDATHLVPGDVIMVSAGDIIPADVRFIRVEGLTVDESILTGESVPVEKLADAVADSGTEEATGVGNLGFSGTSIQTGEGIALVLLTGIQTMLGSIARISLKNRRESIFVRELNRFGSFMIVMLIVTMGFIFSLHVLVKGSSVSIPHLILFVVALVVTLTPEALPVVVAFCLARGAQRMARNQVVVRRLSAIQDLGSIDVLCTDKTGTITENRLAIADVWGDRNSVMQYAYCANQNNGQTNTTSKHSFDALIAQEVKKITKTIQLGERIAFIPFDHQASWSSHALYTVNNGYVLVVRGAYEKVLERCSTFDYGNSHDALAWALQQGNIGRRVLGIAIKRLEHIPPNNVLVQQNDLELVGMISFDDPVKPTAAQALKKARALGVSVKILTGDAAEVAAAVAQKVGLITTTDRVVTGTQLDRMNESEKTLVIQEASVFARISPLQKMDIINRLQAFRNVGFLGEGVNDAPALKRVHVALVVENGSDVAKDVADVILLQKSLHVIVDGIEEGRKAFLNTVKYIHVTLASNFSNFYTLALFSLVMDTLPMLPLQILLVNILTDLPMIAIASDRVDYHDIQKPQRFNFRAIIRKATIFGLVCSVFDLIFFSIYIKKPIILMQTAWFIMSVFEELLFFFVGRSRLPIYEAGRPSVIIVSITTMMLIVTALLPVTTFGQTVFSFVLLSRYDTLFLTSIIMLFLVSMEVLKYLYRPWEED